MFYIGKMNVIEQRLNKYQTKKKNFKFQRKYFEGLEDNFPNVNIFQQWLNGPRPFHFNQLIKSPHGYPGSKLSDDNSNY